VSATPDVGRQPVLLAYCQRGLSLAEEAGYRSFDPFDALDCSLGRVLFRSSQLGARMAVQAGLRSGASPRRAFGIAMRPEAKAASDLLASASVLARRGESPTASLDPLIDLLKSLAIQTPHGRGWGLSFPYASRFVRADAMTPNAYTTTCVAGALLDAAVQVGRDDLVDLVLEALSFISDDLGWIRRSKGDYVRYWLGVDTPITNVQALVALLAMRTGTATGDEQLCGMAHELVHSTVSAQRSDGSWRYSEDGGADFVDSFHTGFVLEALSEFVPLAGSGVAPDVEAAVELGYAYFREHLFDIESGLPLAMSDGRSTTDAQAVAQCAETLSASGRPEDLTKAWQVFSHFPVLERERLIQPRGISPGTFLSLRWHVGPAVLAAARMAERMEQALAVGRE
jgi:hypothetical protein